MKIYVLVGEVEEVAQKFIGGNFEATYCKELICAYKEEKQAIAKKESMKLVKPKRESYCGTQYYKGYYDIQIEPVDLMDIE